MESITTKKLSGMELSVILTLSGLWAKVTTVLTNIWGWLLGIIGFILTYMVSIKELVIVLGVIIGIDFVLGLWAAIKSKVAISSSKMRGTLIKALIYALVLAVAHVIEKQFDFALPSKLLFGLASAVELLSIIANALIIKPDMKFLLIFEVLVKGEITKKVGVPKDKINDILK